jgi:hypothetical protein
MGELASVASSFSTLGSWITLGLGLAFGIAFLVWGHRLGKAASVVLGGMCGLLLGTLIGVAAAVFTGQSGPVLGLAGSVLGLAAGGLAGWFLVRTTMVTIFGTVLGTIAASFTWTLTAPNTPSTIPSITLPSLASTKSAAPSASLPETISAPTPQQSAQSQPKATPANGAQTSSNTAQAQPSAQSPKTTQSPASKPATKQAEKPVTKQADKPARVVVGNAPSANQSLDTVVVEEHGRKRIVIRSKSAVETAQAGSLADGLSALAKAAAGKTNAAKSPDLGSLLQMAQGGQPDPAALQGMLEQMQANGGGGLDSLGAGGLGGLGGLGSLGGLTGGMSDMKQLEGQLAQAATALADIVRRIVISSLVGLVVSTLASVAGAFIKKPLVPLTMSLTGGYCLAGALEASFALIKLSPSPIVLQIITLVIVVAACVVGTMYQMKQSWMPARMKKSKESEEKVAFSPLARSGPRTGSADVKTDELGSLLPAGTVVSSNVDPLGPANAPKGKSETPPSAKKAA